MKHLNPTHELVYLFIKQRYLVEAQHILLIAEIVGRSIPRSADVLMHHMPKTTSSGAIISHKAVTAALRHIAREPK